MDSEVCSGWNEALRSLVALDQGLGSEEDRFRGWRVEILEDLGALDGAVGDLDSGGKGFDGSGSGEEEKPQSNPKP